MGLRTSLAGWSDIGDRDRDVIPTDLLSATDRFQRDVDLAEVGVRAWRTDLKYQAIARRSEENVLDAIRRWLDVFNRYAPEPVVLRNLDKEIAESVSRDITDSRMGQQATDEGGAA
jgi:hypothetical protein